MHASFLLAFFVVVAFNVLTWENKKLVALCQASTFFTMLLVIEMEPGILM